jgi:hypothetical protein
MFINLKFKYNKVAIIGSKEKTTALRQATKSTPWSTSYPGSFLWKDPGERWSRVSHNMGDGNFVLLGRGGFVQYSQVSVNRVIYNVYLKPTI